MARTVILDNILIQGIMVNRVRENGEYTGYSSTISYIVVDSVGNPAVQGHSERFTMDTNYPEDQKLSADSSDLITNFANALIESMKLREEL